MKKNYKIWIYPLILMGFALNLTISCKQNSDTVTDIDGNVYKTVTIGTQIWMKENLKVTKYRNGDSIPYVIDNTQWSNLTTGSFCDYNNDANNSTTYGRLYNWYAINDSRNIAPEGWHLPTDAEWSTLIDYLGGKSVAGGKLKEIGTTYWNSPNTGATNESGFTAHSGVPRDSYGTFGNVGRNGYWWCSTENSTNCAWVRYMYYNSSDVGRDSGRKLDGYSVRCVRDAPNSNKISEKEVEVKETPTELTGTYRGTNNWTKYKVTFMAGHTPRYCFSYQWSKLFRHIYNGRKNY